VDNRTNVKARYWESMEEDRIKCTLCPHGCVINNGKFGICMVRKNVNGELIASGYGHTISLTMDPIEKKPLFHFKPGSSILSVGPNGCNLKCMWCQNWQISQKKVITRFISPENLVNMALREKSVGVAFTYTEPLIWLEYIVDVALIGKPKGLSMVAVTNGYINSEPLDELLNYLDAVNIDLKSMFDEDYKKYMGGTLAPVLNTIKKCSERLFVEVTNLIIPGINDSDEHIHKLVDFVASVNPTIPLHFSRYHPYYKMDNPITPEKTLLRAAKIAQEKLKFVYIGNIKLPGFEDTNCPVCGNMLISRTYYFTKKVGITEERKCSKCGADIDFVH